MPGSTVPARRWSGSHTTSSLRHVEIDDAEGQRDDLDVRKTTGLQQLAEFLGWGELPYRLRQVRVRAVVARDHPPDDGQHAVRVPEIERTKPGRGGQPELE